MYFLVNRMPQIVLIGALRRILHQSHIIRVHSLGYARKYCQFISPVDVDTVDKLKTTFGWTDEESNTIERFLKISGKECLKSLAYLCTKNVSISTITQNLHLLNIPSDKLEAGINKIQTAQWRKIDDFIPFLSLPLEKIEKTNFDNNKNLIYEISEKYSLTVSEISRNFARVPRTLQKSPHLVLQRFDVMVEHELHPRDIIRDPAIFVTSFPMLKKRLELIKMHNVRRPKPFMMKCADKSFEKMIEIRKELNEECSEAFEHIAFTLDLNGRAMVCLFKKHEFVNDLDLDTVTRVLTILLQTYTKKEIYKNIRLLRLPPDLIEKRLRSYRELCDDKCPPNKLALIDADFSEYLSSISYEKEFIRTMNEKSS